MEEDQLHTHQEIVSHNHQCMDKSMELTIILIYISKETIGILMNDLKLAMTGALKKLHITVNFAAIGSIALEAKIGIAVGFLKILRFKVEEAIQLSFLK